MNVWLKSDCLVTETFYFVMFYLQVQLLYITKRIAKVLIIVPGCAGLWVPLKLSGGVSRISEKGFICIAVCVGGRFTDFISFFLNFPWKGNNLASVRPNYFIFIGYLKT